MRKPIITYYLEMTEPSPLGPPRSGPPASPPPGGGPPPPPGWGLYTPPGGAGVGRARPGGSVCRGGAHLSRAGGGTGGGGLGGAPPGRLVGDGEAGGQGERERGGCPPAAVHRSRLRRGAPHRHR